MRYIVIIQPANGGPDHWMDMGIAAKADAIAKWIHRTTQAAVAVFDEKFDKERLVLGDFDRNRT